MTRATTNHERNFGRRTMLGVLGATGALWVVGCSDDGSATTEGTGTGTGGTSTTGEPDPTTGTSATGSSSSDDSTSTGEPTTASPTTGEPSECGVIPASWAGGGTAAMTGKACYPDPFAGGVVTCPLLCETTAGPCTTATTLDRQDVSEGFAGLPVRLALLIVDAETCAPVDGARVEIWHTQRTGVYSGVTPNPQMCYGKDPGAAEYLYFRGIQTAGSDGRVDFDTCFPGWYSGRAVHIHFRVIVGETTYTTSQLFFPEDVTEEIFAGHAEYQEFGQPNTHLDDDNIIGGEDDPSTYIMTVARMTDGAMLASKVIGIRSSTDQATCDVSGGMGGGMPMPPPMP